MMVKDVISPGFPQPTLFTFDEGRERIEFFPAVWSATEKLTSSNNEVRREGLDRLLELNAPRFSPLVVYIFATCLTDPDVSIRTRIVEALGEVLLPDDNGQPAPDNVRLCLTGCLANLRTRQTYALLQVAVEAPTFEKHVSRLINACSFASNHLVDIMADRTLPLDLRVQAVHIIGQVGFMDAVSPLKRLEARLDTRLYGQRVMPFAPSSRSSEIELLRAIQDTLDVLQAL